jgi:hypothetical protein
MSDQLRRPQVGPDHMASLPSPGEAARLASFLQEHLRWSAFWDKGHGVWRVAKDDPDSTLYAESSDVDTVIGYITENS